MFQTWERLCIREQQAIRGLKTVWRQRVADDDTRAVMNIVFVNNSPRAAPREFYEISPPEEMVFALLGTPNGSGIAGMLSNFVISFGRKSVASVCE
jgi:hypothetical protein